MDKVESDNIALQKSYALHAEGKFLEAFRHLSVLEKSGCIESSILLGYMYWVGQGVIKNYDEALSRFSRAADSGILRAEFYKACVLEEKNKIQESIESYKMSANSGSISASYALFRLSKKYQSLISSNEGDYFLEKAFNGGHAYARREMMKKNLRGNKGFISRFLAIPLFFSGFYKFVKILLNDPNSDKLH